MVEEPQIGDHQLEEQLPRHNLGYTPWSPERREEGLQVGAAVPVTTSLHVQMCNSAYGQYGPSVCIHAGQNLLFAQLLDIPCHVYSHQPHLPADMLLEAHSMHSHSLPCIAAFVHQISTRNRACAIADTLCCCRPQMRGYQW